MQVANVAWKSHATCLPYGNIQAEIELMSPICHLRCSCHLWDLINNLASGIMVAPASEPSCGRGQSGAPPPTQQATHQALGIGSVKAKGKGRAVPVQLPAPAPLPASNSSPERSSHDSIKWEPYPCLIEQLLQWLWDNPTNWAILFNEKA